MLPTRGSHQLAFLTPGIRPELARSRKQMRQMPNLRYTARARPHSLQRRLIRICSRGGILTLSGVFLLASSFAICLRNLTFCASVVMVRVVAFVYFLPGTVVEAFSLCA